MSTIRAIRQIATLAMFWTAVVSFPAVVRAEVKLGVENNRGALAASAQWQGLADYLSAELAQPVTVVPVLGDKIVDTVGARQVDFMLTNPAIVVALQAVHQSELVAGVVQPWGSQFAGVIFTTPATGIKSLQDVKGKKLLTHTATSAGGYLYQRYHLHLNGIEIPRDFADVHDVAKQDDIVLSVKSGVFDVGFVRTGVLEDLFKKGSVKPDEIVVLDKANDPSYPFVHTTALYPEWSMVAAKNTDPALIAKVKSALFAVKADSPVAIKANIRGFEPPHSMESLHILMKAVKAAPFDK